MYRFLIPAQNMTFMSGTTVELAADGELNKFKADNFLPSRKFAIDFSQWLISDWAVKISYSPPRQKRTNG